MDDYTKRHLDGLELFMKANKVTEPVIREVIRRSVITAAGSKNEIDRLTKQLNKYKKICEK